MIIIKFILMYLGLVAGLILIGIGLIFTSGILALAFLGELFHDSKKKRP